MKELRPDWSYIARQSIIVDRACIAYPDEKTGWVGVMVHKDGQPKKLGPVIWKLLGHFLECTLDDGKLACSLFLEEYVRSTPSGYTVFPEVEKVANPFDSKHWDYDCHGNKTSPIEVDWLYLIDGSQLKVYSRHTKSAIGKPKPPATKSSVSKSTMPIWDYGNKILSHRLVFKINVAERSKPNWCKIPDVEREKVPFRVIDEVEDFNPWERIIGDVPYKLGSGETDIWKENVYTADMWKKLESSNTYTLKGDQNKYTRLASV